MKLVDYKVRIIDAHRGSAAKPRVVIESARGEERWSTLGCSENVIEASWQALWDSLELPLLRDRDAETARRGISSVVSNLRAKLSTSVQA